jgi:O-antigen ligase
MFKDKPFFGHGPNTFRKLCFNPEYIVSEHSCTTHPHNSYIQLLAETGIFGFLVLLFAFFYFLKKYILKLFNILFSKYKKNKLSLNNFIEINFLINIFPLSTAGNFFNNWTSIIYYFPLGFYLYYRNKIKILAKI